MTPDQLTAIGRDVECVTLARAVKWHVEHRIVLNGRRRSCSADVLSADCRPSAGGQS